MPEDLPSESGRPHEAAEAQEVLGAIRLLPDAYRETLDSIASLVD